MNGQGWPYLATGDVEPPEQSMPEHEADPGGTDSDLAAAARSRDTHEMHGDLATHWDAWSADIGQRVLPAMAKLQEELPNLSSAMICTSDGFNLCSIGVEEHRVSQVSALTSSLYPISSAMADSLHADACNEFDTVSLAGGDTQTVVTAIKGLVIGNALLWVSAENTSLGVLLVRAHSAAETVRNALRVDH